MGVRRWRVVICLRRRARAPTIVDVAAADRGRRTRGTRARDSDRAATCQILDAAFADGQLSMEEHRQRVSAATNAATLGELQPLVDDLQTAAAIQPFTPTHRYRAVILAAVSGVVVCVAVVAWLVFRHPGLDTTASTTPAEPTSTHVLAAEPTTAAEAPAEPAPVVLTPPANLQSADGLTRVIDTMRERFGDTTGYELAVMSDEAMLARPDPSDEHSKLIYSFDGGWGDPSTRKRSDTDDVTDLAAFDIPAAAAALQAAPATLRIAPTDVKETSLDIDLVADPGGPGGLELLIKVTTTAGPNGWIYLDGASNIKRVEYPG